MARVSCCCSAFLHPHDSASPPRPTQPRPSATKPRFLACPASLIFTPLLRPSRLHSLRSLASIELYRFWPAAWRSGRCARRLWLVRLALWAAGSSCDSRVRSPAFPLSCLKTRSVSMLGLRTGCRRGIAAQFTRVRLAAGPPGVAGRVVGLGCTLGCAGKVVGPPGFTGCRSLHRPSRSVSMALPASAASASLGPPEVPPVPAAAWADRWSSSRAGGTVGANPTVAASAAAVAGNTADDTQVEIPDSSRPTSKDSHNKDHRRNKPSCPAQFIRQP